MRFVFRRLTFSVRLADDSAVCAVILSVPPFVLRRRDVLLENVTVTGVDVARRSRSPASVAVSVPSAPVSRPLSCAAASSFETRVAAAVAADTVVNAPPARAAVTESSAAPCGVR